MKRKSISKSASPKDLIVVEGSEVSQELEDLHYLKGT